MNDNIHYVNNTESDIRPIFPVFQSAYASGVLDDDYADLFAINFIRGCNADGSDRMIINTAD